MSPDELGAEMIIALQAMAGVEEPKDKALAAWRGFSESDKQKTIAAYRFCFGKSQPDGNAS